MSFQNVREYSVLLSQSGDGDPSATEQRNDFTNWPPGGQVALQWGRVAAGVFIMEFEEEFDTSKIRVIAGPCHPDAPNGPYEVEAGMVGSQTLRVVVKVDGTPTDDRMHLLPVSMVVYP